MAALLERLPKGLFWKVFLACWMTAALTGLMLMLLGTLLPEPLLLPGGQRSPPSMLMPMLVGCLLALLVSAVLAWSMSRPIRLLRQAFSDAAAGRLDVRVGAQLRGQRDELADLGRDYDSMAAQLQALLSAQRRLLHDVSHELRSPLARLQMATGLLRRSPDSLQTWLQRIDHEVERLDQLVGEVLTLARLESGAVRPERQEIDVMALLEAISNDARFEARAAGRELRFDARPASRLIAADGELLLRAFENVIRNALKYSPAGGCVDVHADLADASGWLRVSVADRGPGLPAAKLDAIFEPFVRGGSAMATEGFGLGLAIARRAIELHGGEIRAQQREGGGLVVDTRLPLGAAANPQAAFNPP